MIESQTQKILRYALPADDELLGKAELFYDLGGSGGDGCVFDAAGNLWVADFHRPDTKQRAASRCSAPRASCSPTCRSRRRSSATSAFGGKDHDEIFCTTGDPPGVFHAKVGVKGFAGHPGKPMKVVALPERGAAEAAPGRGGAASRSSRPSASANSIRQVWTAIEAQLEAICGRIDRCDASSQRRRALLPALEQAAARHAKDKTLLAEIKRLGGTATIEVDAPAWLREIAGDEGLPVFGRITEIDPQRAHRRPQGTDAEEARRPRDRRLAEAVARRPGSTRAAGSCPAPRSPAPGLVHLKHLKNLEVLNVCLTAVSDDGFEHLAGMTKMKRMVVCSSKITGSGSSTSTA